MVSQRFLDPLGNYKVKLLDASLYVKRLGAHVSTAQFLLKVCSCLQSFWLLLGMTIYTLLRNRRTALHLLKEVWAFER